MAVVRLVIVTGLVVIAAVYVGVGIGLLLFQERFIFVPSGPVMAPQEAGLRTGEEVTLETPDGEMLYAWYLAPPASDAPVILYFQGNGSTIAPRAQVFHDMHMSGYGVLALSYRGFPGSTGKPSEAGLITDGVTAFDWLKEREHEIIIYGQSLGSGVAVQVAAQRQAKAVVLEAPFRSALAVAEYRYPIYPVMMMARHPFRSDRHIGGVDAPLLIVGAGLDTIIPPIHSNELYDLANEPKKLVMKEQSGHNSLWVDGIWEDVLSFLEEKGVSAGRAQALPN